MAEAREKYLQKQKMFEKELQEKLAQDQLTHKVLKQD